MSKEITLRTRKFMGVDPSITNTSVCICEFGIGKNYAKDIVFHKNIVVSKSAKGVSLDKRGEALYDIKRQFSKMLEKYQPTVICVENFSYASSYNLPLQGMVTGNILTAIVEHKLYNKLSTSPAMYFPSPQTVKCFITSQNSAKKELMMMKILKHYGVEMLDNNLADSFALAQLAKVIYILNKKFYNLYEDEEVTIQMRKSQYEKIVDELATLGINRNNIERAFKVEEVYKRLKIKK